MAPSGAIFLSYASQDGQAAQRLCEALRAAGIEVWFDRSELRGGEAWDRQIRKQIHDCALFIPVISSHTEARREGYFRREWKLAVDRTADMAEDVAFLLPVVIDSTPDATARVPDRFREVQWSRVPDGHASPTFIQRVQRLLSPAQGDAPTTASAAPPLPMSDVTPREQHVRRGVLWSKPALLAAAAVLVLGVLAYLVADKLRSPKHAAAAAPAAFSPPPHSLAVLPFVNMSGDKEQEYFSDGLTEELLNSLARINELQVAARTSSFSFKGEKADIGTIAHKLNVAAVLEGSVRRSGHTMRITAQLVSAVTGFHLWSETYDRDLGDVLKLQTEIADAVANALKVNLLGNVATKIELGGTHTPGAFDAYLRGLKAATSSHNVEDLRAGISAFSEAIRLDPKYALALSWRSKMLSGYAQEYALGAEQRKSLEQSETDAREAIALAPELGDAHLSLAEMYSGSADYVNASEEYERAASLAPGSAEVLRDYGRFSVQMGRTDAGIAAIRRAIVLDPLNPRSHYRLAEALYHARRYNDSVQAYQEFINLDPDSPHAHAFQGMAYYGLDDFQKARIVCEAKSGQWNQLCLALTYAKLGRKADAEGQLAKMTTALGDGAAYQYAEIYVQWGNAPKALEWLETAWRLRDPGLVGLKVDPLVDPLRKEPRFQTIERELRFPN